MKRMDISPFITAIIGKKINMRQKKMNRIDENLKKAMNWGKVKIPNSKVLQGMQSRNVVKRKRRSIESIDGFYLKVTSKIYDEITNDKQTMVALGTMSKREEVGHLIFIDKHIDVKEYNKYKKFGLTASQAKKIGRLVLFVFGDPGGDRVYLLSVEEFEKGLIDGF